MPVPPALARDPAVAGPLGSLALSVVRPAVPMMIVRAIRWYRDLARLGLHAPLFMVHDLGLLYAAPKDQLHVGARPVLAGVAAKSPGLRELAQSYLQVVTEIGESEPSLRARSLRLTDDLVVVVLARVIGAIVERAAAKSPYPPDVPYDPELVRDLDPQLPGLYAAVARPFERSALEAVAKTRLHVLTLADALDIDTLRLLGMLGPESGAASALAQVDLLAAVSSRGANDIVNFSLELLPSILETRRTRAAGTQAAFGYAGIGNKGSLDSMVLTELAWDNDEL